MYHTKVYCVKTNLFLSRLVASSSSLITWSDINPPFKPRQNPSTPGSLESFDKSWKASNLVNLSFFRCTNKKSFSHKFSTIILRLKKEGIREVYMMRRFKFHKETFGFSEKDPLEAPEFIFLLKVYRNTGYGYFLPSGRLFSALYLPGLIYLSIFYLSAWRGVH